MMTDTQQTLYELTRTVGEPWREWVILGEGNTSLRSSPSTFWVKASGQQMEQITPLGFVEVYFDPIMGLFDSPPSTNSAMQAIIKSAMVDQASLLRPSIEVSFHAMLLAECQVNCIVHTHPVAVNWILCSQRAQQFAQNRLFPDEAVLCGPESVYVPYADPGLPLAFEMRAGVRNYMQRYTEAPKVILLGNHGLIALGQTPTEALNVTAMCVKAAKIFAGACSVGEPVFMSKDDILHIYHRPDEIYRRQQFVATPE
jgi:rhamnose utilization protein RhaD (predicted bifunctional aldolase and dehydrogenase)